MEDLSQVRKPLPSPGKGSLPLPATLAPTVLEAMPSPQQLPGGHGYDGSLRAPVDIYRGGETEALERLKVSRWWCSPLRSRNSIQTFRPCLLMPSGRKTTSDLCLPAAMRGRPMRTCHCQR